MVTTTIRSQAIARHVDAIPETLQEELAKNIYNKALSAFEMGRSPISDILIASYIRSICEILQAHEIRIDGDQAVKDRVYAHFVHTGIRLAMEHSDSIQADEIPPLTSRLNSAIDRYCDSHIGLKAPSRGR